MPSNEEIFDKVRETLIDALGLDDDEVTTLPLLKQTLGANYLRIRSTAEETDEAGLLIESLEVDVSRSW